MIQQQSAQYFLRKGDWVEIIYQDYSLYSEGFKTSEVEMRNNQHPLNCIFVLQSSQTQTNSSKKYVHFDEPLVLRHKLSNKYLSYNQHFASKSELKLRNIISENCEFLIRPLYKCQTLKSLNVRNGQQCVLTLASMLYSSQKVGLVVAKYEKGSRQRVGISLKKNENSPLRLVRRSLSLKGISGLFSLQIYRLKHNQTKNLLAYSKIWGEKSVELSNEKNNYCSYILLEKELSDPRDQIAIHREQKVYIRFFGNRQYLAFSDNSVIYLTQQPNQESLFVLQQYASQAELSVNLSLKVMHLKSQKYLSILQGNLCIKNFTPYNTWQFSCVSEDELVDVIFLNDTFAGLMNSLNNGQVDSKDKRKIRSILKQSIKFCYLGKKVINDFCNLQSVKPSLKYEEQILFSKIGYLPLLFKISTKMVESHREENSELEGRGEQAKNSDQFSENEYIFIQLALMICAICKDNKENLVIFCEQIKVFFQFVGQIRGIFQLLFQLFGYNAMAVELFQNLQFTVKKTQLIGFAVLLQYLYGKQFSIKERIKIIKLLTSLVQDQHKNSILSHEKLLLQTLNQIKIQKILFPLSKSNDNTLIVHLTPKDKQQLKDIIDSHRYNSELTLLCQQLRLYICLCKRGSKKHFQLFRSIISQEILKYYLMQEMEIKYLTVFMEILIEIYLNISINTKSHSHIALTKNFNTGPFHSSQVSHSSSLRVGLLQHEVELEMQEMSSDKLNFIMDLNSLKQIKRLILSLLYKKIETAVLDQDMIIYMLAFQKFVQIDICSPQEQREIIDKLTITLNQSLVLSTEINENFILQYLQMVEYDLDIKLKQQAIGLLQSIRNNYNPELSRLESSERIIAATNERISSCLAHLSNSQVITAIEGVIQICIVDRKINLFLQASQLYDKVYFIGIYFTKTIKNCIPVECQDSIQLFQTVSKLSVLLNSAVAESLYGVQQVQRETGLKKLQQIIIESCGLIQGDDQQENLNILAQKLMSQLGFGRFVVQFVSQRRDELRKPQRSQLFSQIFRFLTLLSLNCDSNFLDNLTQLSKLGPIFKHIDRGQIKMLYSMTQLQAAKSANTFLVSSWLAAMKSSFTPRVEIPLGLLRLLVVEQFRVDLSLKLMRDTQLLPALLKLQHPGQYFSLQVVRLCQFRQEWILYLLCCFRLLRVLIQTHGTHHSSFITVIRDFLPIRLVLNLIQQAFRLEITSGENSLLYVFILKQTRLEIINLFNLLHLTQLEQENYELTLEYMKKISGYLTHKYVQEHNNDQILKALIHNLHEQPNPENTLKHMLTHYLRLSIHGDREITSQIINPLNSHLHLFINQYYQFLFTLYEKLKDETSQIRIRENIFNFIGSVFGEKNTKIDEKISFNVELQTFVDKLWKQYQELLSEKLTFNQFSIDSLAYFSSVKAAEELTKRNAGLKHKILQQQEERLLLQGQQFFQHEQLKFTLDSFLSNRNKIEKYLYQAILIILHNRNVKANSSLNHNKFSTRMKDIVEIIVDKLRDSKTQDSTFISFCQLLHFFLTNSDNSKKHKDRKDREWEPHLQTPQILYRLGNTREDTNNVMLGAWIQGQVALLQDNLNGRFSASRRRRKVEMTETQDSLLWLGGVRERLRGVFLSERQLYDKKLLLQQSHSYFQHRRLNHFLNHYTLSPEMLLRWLLLKLRYNQANVERYFQLLEEVALTLKTYARFLLDFEKKYVPGQIQAKLRLGFRVLLQAVAGGNMRVLLMLLQHQVWEEINVVLLLDDSLPRAREELELSSYDFIKMLTRTKLPPLSASYLQGVLQLYNNSVAIYGEKGEVLAGSYPLVPIKSHYRDLKTHAIALVDQFSHTPSIAPQFFSKLDLKALDLNVINTYHKYHYLFNNYTIAAIYTHAEYHDHPQQTIAQNLGFQNAVRMAGLRMRADQLNGRNELSDRYLKIRVNITKKSIQSYLLIFKDFIIDLVLLLVGVCLRMVRRSRPAPSPTPDQIFDFFLERLGQVEVQWEGRLYLCDFMLYPECKLTQRARQQCLKQLNFASNQLKRQSIASAMNRSCLRFQNELQFSLSFWKAGIIIFLAQYIRVFRHIGNAIIVLQNLLLVTNQLETLNFNGFSIGYPFEIFSILNIFVSVPVLAVTLIKNIPLVIKVHRYNLQQGIGFLSRGYHSFGPVQRLFVLIIKTIFTWELAYQVIYTGVVCLVLLNKLFAAILLLDVLLRIRTLKSLLISICRPIYQIILTVIALIILQYFFSIVLYFFFEQNVNGHCDTLGDCFTFVLYASFRAVNGFVGYLFQENYMMATTTSISIFAVFEDVYAIVIHTIMIAVLLAVVINSFVVTKADNAKQKQALSHACIICNIDSSRFNLQNRTSFQKHKSLTHYLFNYFHYRHRLNKVRKELMTDLQISVLQSKNNDWIPDNRTAELETESKM